jgi:ribosomal protein S18 acetylase RimI-like enzyme
MTTPPAGLSLHRLERLDIPAVVDLHVRAFPGFFLSFLGPRFLREFYGSFVDEPNGLAFVAEDQTGGQLLGVVVGPLRPAGYFRRLLIRRWWAFCLASVMAVCRRPWVIPRLWRAVFYRGEAPTGPARALLSSLAVAPEARRRGVGLALINAWTAEAQCRGAAGGYLTTDAEGNEAVNAFYARAGWTLEETFVTREGRKMYRWTLDWPGTPANA